MAKKKIFNGKTYFLRYENVPINLVRDRINLIKQEDLLHKVDRKTIDGKSVADIYIKSPESPLLKRPKGYNAIITRLEKYDKMLVKTYESIKDLSPTDFKYDKDKKQVLSIRMDISKAIDKVKALFSRIIKTSD